MTASPVVGVPAGFQFPGVVHKPFAPAIQVYVVGTITDLPAHCEAFRLPELSVSIVLVIEVLDELLVNVFIQTPAAVFHLLNLISLILPATSVGVEIKLKTGV